MILAKSNLLEFIKMPQTNLNKVNKQLRTTLGVESHEITIEEVEIPPESESTSAEAIETLGDMSEASELNAQAEDLQSIDESGNELITAVECAVTSGKGLRPLEAVALRAVVKQLTGKYTKEVVLAVPARESFGGTSDALETTVLALETLQSSFQSFWDATKNQFLKVVEAFQKLFRSVVQKFQSVTKRAQALKARAEDSTEDGSKVIEMDVSNLKVTNTDIQTAVLDGLKNIHEVVAALLKNSRQVDDRAEVNKGVDALKESNVWSDYVSGVNSTAKRTFDAIENSKDNVSALLPGNRAITFTEGEANTRDQFSFESIVRFGDETPEVKKDVQALASKEIIAAADLVIAIAGTIAEYDKVWSRSSSKAARLVQGINAAVKGDISKLENEEAVDAAAKEEKESRLTRFKINVSALINHVRRLDKFSSDLIAYAQLVSLEVLVYGEKSVNDSTTQQAA